MTTQRQKHEWGPSRVGHGEAQCIHCLVTNREAWVLGEFCIQQDSARDPGTQPVATAIDELAQRQTRILHFLAKYPTWHFLVELDRVRLLQPGDIEALPSLVNRMLVETRRMGSHQTYRITPAGKIVAAERKS